MDDPELERPLLCTLVRPNNDRARVNQLWPVRFFVTVLPLASCHNRGIGLSRWNNTLDDNCLVATRRNEIELLNCYLFDPLW